MADEEFTASSDESEGWHEESFFYVPDSFIEDECKRLGTSNLTTDELINKLAECTYRNYKLLAQLEKSVDHYRQLRRALDYAKNAVDEMELHVQKHREISKAREIIHDALVDSEVKVGAYKAVKTYKKEKAASAANARHSKPNGARAKAEAIRKVWASGKYSSRDICAEQECAGLDMSYSAARKALRNTPDPT